jgi:hypothetical protein
LSPIVKEHVHVRPANLRLRDGSVSQTRPGSACPINGVTREFGLAIIIIIAVATICWLWVPAVISARGRGWPIVTQFQVDSACLSGANVFDAGLLCPDGKPVVARDLQRRESCGDAVRRNDVMADLKKPVPPSVVLFVAIVVAWILAPLLERVPRP